METVELKAVRREKSTKGALKKLRREGMIPGIVYGRSKEPISIAIDRSELKSVLGTAAGMNVLVELKINGEGALQTETVMIKDIQHDILIRDNLLHIDLLRVSMTEKIEVSVPLILVGEPEGVKDGGVLQQLLREVNIRCLPADIPDQLDADVSSLQIGESLQISDLSVPEGIEMLEEADEVVVVVSAPEQEVVEEEAAEEAGEAAETADQSGEAGEGTE
ncbi:MAG: 50S ribosomal protein L25/general stress protein Ctc [Dethiobacteria bacterium]|jgi:large subunit ribosomal protein L25|nr:50S ribosomal protein L25/general stress protein Ctc [Bacillota bacterium]